MSTVTLKNPVDNHVIEPFPARNKAKARRLYISNGGGTSRQAYMYFSKPYPAGATIISAKLRVYNGNTQSGSITLTAQRVNAKWGVRGLTWNNKPGTTGASPSVAKTSAAAGTEWLIDVTALIQAVADGGVWYGFRLTTNSATIANWWHSANSNTSDYRPSLEITWSDAPDAPEDLRPDGNRAVHVSHPVLRFDFTDVSGDTDMSALQVQINASDVWTSPSFDSGEVASSLPELDLATTAYGGLAAASSTYWRVRVKDGAGIWSQWSDSAQFQRIVKPGLTITNPAVNPNHFVTEPTPPISWTFANQRAYQVIITNITQSNKWIWTSGKITSTVQTVTLPRGVITENGKTYKVIIRAWDHQDREGTPATLDTVYAEQSRDFTFNKDNTVAAVTGFSAVADATMPWANLSWSRTTQPDEWVIYRNGVVVDEEIPGNDLFVSGTSYAYVDKKAPLRQDVTWSVGAVVNGKVSDNNPTDDAQVRAAAPMLMKLDGTQPIMFLNPNLTAEQISFQEVQDVLGDAPPVLISQSLRGYEGSCSGILSDDAISGVTARQMRNRLRILRENPGESRLLYMVDETLEVAIYNVKYKPLARNNTVWYAASFDFFQVDY